VGKLPAFVVAAGKRLTSESYCWEKTKNIKSKILTFKKWFATIKSEAKAKTKKMRRVQNGKHSIVVADGPPFPGLCGHGQDAGHAERTRSVQGWGAKGRHHPK
jgi:hypothetical protein